MVPTLGLPMAHLLGPLLAAARPKPEPGEAEQLFGLRLRRAEASRRVTRFFLAGLGVGLAVWAVVIARLVTAAG